MTGASLRGEPLGSGYPHFRAVRAPFLRSGDKPLRCGTPPAVLLSLARGLQMKKLLFLIIHLLFFCFQMFSQEIKFSGEAGTFWAGALRSENRGDLILGDTWLKAKFDAFYEKSSAYGEARAGFDDVSGKSYYELKEIYIDYTSDFWGLRIGRQKIVWGKADGIDITNVICPKDCSSLHAIINDEYSAIDSARLSFTGEKLSFDAYFIPFFTASALPEEKTAIFSAVNLPEESLKNSEYALKFSGYFSRFDIALYGFYGWEDSPFLNYSISPSESSDAGLEIEAEYERLLMFGLDAAIPIGQTVLRLEGAYFPERHFQVNSGNILAGSEVTEKHGNFLALAGLDWTPASWTLTAQYFCSLLFGGTENLEQNRNFDNGVTLSLSKSMFSETLKISASGVLNLVDFDSALELSGEYSLSDSIFLEAGAYIFSGGKEAGTYGLYEDYTSLYLKARCVF